MNTCERLRSCSDRARTAQLGRSSKQKPADEPAEVSHNRKQDQCPSGRRREPKGHQVGFQLDLQRAAACYRSHCREIIELREHRMSTPEPLENNGQPARNQPGSHRTVRIRLQTGSVKPPLASSAKLQHGKDRAYHRIHRVLNIRDQLVRKEGNTQPAPPALKPRYRNPPLLKRIQLDRVALIRLDRPVAVRATTNRAVRPQEGEKNRSGPLERIFRIPKPSRIC